MTTILAPSQTNPLITYQPPTKNGNYPQMRAHTSRLSQRVRAVPPSGIRKYFDIAATMDDVITLGIGEPDFVTPEPILQAGIASLQRGNTGYTSNSGLLEVRAAVAHKLQQLYAAPAYNIEKEILITVGVSEAMYLIMQAILDPGDEVIVPQPCFVSYTASVLLAGGKVVDIPTYARNNFAVQAADIEAAITPHTKAILIGFPSNPTAQCVELSFFERVIALAKKHDILVVHDLAYADIVYDGYRAPSIMEVPGAKDVAVEFFTGYLIWPFSM